MLLPATVFAQVGFHLLGYMGDQSLVPVPSSSAYAISADGKTVVGGSTHGTATESLAYNVFKWTAATGMQANPKDKVGNELILGPGAGVSADGSVVAGDANYGTAGSAYVWDGNNVVLLFPGSKTHSYTRVFHVSPSGNFVIGAAPNSANIYNGFKYGDHTGFLQLLPVLAAGRAEIAFGCSRNAEVIAGSSGASLDDPFPLPVYWDSKGVHRIHLPDIYLGGVAGAVDEAGDLIAGVAMSKTAQDLFIYNVLLDETTIVPGPSNFPIMQVTGMSGDGAIICGLYANPSSPMGNAGFVWSIEVPSRVQDAESFLIDHKAGTNSVPVALYGVSDDGTAFCGIANPDDDTKQQAFVAKVAYALKIASVDYEDNQVVGGFETVQATAALNRPLLFDEQPFEVSVSSSDPAVLAAPSAPLVFKPGQGSIKLNMNTSVVNSDTNVALTYTSEANEIVTTVLVRLRPFENSFRLSKSKAVGGKVLVGTVLLAFPMEEDVVVALASSNTSAATVPPTVTIPTGQTSADFNITTLKVDSTKFVQIEAAAQKKAVFENLELLPPLKLLDVKLADDDIVGGADRMTATVSLNRAVQLPEEDPFQVTLTSSDPSVIPSITSGGFSFSSGTSTRILSVQTFKVSNDKPVDLSFECSENKITKTETVQAVAFENSFTLSPNPVVGGNPVKLTVFLSKALDEDVVVTLAVVGDTAAASVPPSVTIPAGSTSASITVTTRKVTTTPFVQIEAAAQHKAVFETLTIKPK